MTGPWPPAGFTPAGDHSRKLACDTCGARGYNKGTWMDVHRRPHHPCPTCGRQLVAKLDGTPRVHTRCPHRPADQQEFRSA